MENLEIEKKDLEFILTNTKSEFEKLSKCNILFTGANGFLGYYFIKVILFWNEVYPKKKIALYALDNFGTGIPKWLKSANVKILKKDVIKYKIPISKTFDYIIHAASIASPIFYRQFPIETMKANVQGLINALEYMVLRKKTKHPVCSFILTELCFDFNPKFANNRQFMEIIKKSSSHTIVREIFI